MSAFERLVARHRASGGPLIAMSASGQLGYGIPLAAFQAGLARMPDFIGCDMGSIDPGPYYLGSGQMGSDPDITRRDLRLVLGGACRLDIPLVIGNAGTAGAGPQLDATLAMIRAIAAEEGLRFRLARIDADVPQAAVVAAMQAGRLEALGRMAMPDAAEIGRSRIVAQMGMAPFERAFEAGADVVVAGRACDTAIFATIPCMLGYSVGLATHMAKIIECSSLCCVPGGRDAILGQIDADGFVIESLNPVRHATPLSVAAHSLYEQTQPFSVAEPRGTLHLEDALYTDLDGHRTRVSGARFVPSSRLRVKIEGSVREGARGVLLAASADPGFVAELDPAFKAVEASVRAVVDTRFQLFPRVYGRGAVGLWPAPEAASGSGEAFIFVECVAETAADVRSVLTSFKQFMLHYGFPGRLCTGGNLAFPITPPELDAGEAYRFSLYHLMDVAGETDLFPVHVETV